jgi:SAM-dependent methyltransferase
MTLEPSLTEWYETFFDELAHDVWRGLVPDEHSDAEARFLAAALGLDDGRPARLLDVPAGDGRLAERLAAAGHAVTGVDISSTAVDRLAALAAAGASVTGVLGDMEGVGDLLAGTAPFDGAYCFGNSFSYLDDDATAAFVRGVATHLRPGARFVVDHPSAAECVLRHDFDGAVDEHRRGDVALAIETTYDARASAMVGRMRLERDGEVAVREVRHRVTTSAQVVRALEAAGFAVLDLLGGIDGAAFRPGAPTLIVVAELRTDRSR